MNAEQYRTLVNKLEAIQEAEVAAFQNAGGNPPEGEVVGSVAAEPPAEAPVPTSTPQDANQIPTIEAATFSQAYAKAKKMGLKKFKWCGVYAVKDPVRPQPAKKQSGYWGQGNSRGNVTVPGSILGPQHKGGDDEAPAGTFG